MGKEKQSAGRHGEEFWAQESKSNIGFKLMTAQGWTQGQGLGKGGAGRTNFIRAKKKDDVLGLGAKQGEDDSWSAMTGLYNELLQRLSVEGGDHLHENGGVSKVAEVEDTSKTLQDYIVKKRLYGRFRKAKDTCGYSENDMAAILGKKSEPAAPKPEPLGYATKAVSAVASVEKKEGDDGSGVKTVTSKMSIRDYFSKKMSVGGSRYSAAGGAGFTEEFQEQHYNQLTKVADNYSGKMGLGSGRSSDPWEDNYRASFSSTTTNSFASIPPPSSASLVEEKSKEVKEEKPSKKKKKKDPEPLPIPVEEEKPKKSKKSKVDSSSSSSQSVAAPSSSSTSFSSSSVVSESTKKSKKNKTQEPVATPAPTPEETEKPKKHKKARVYIEEVEKKHEEQKEKRLEKKLRKEKQGQQEETPKLCSYCSSSDVPMTCGGCQKAFYCGVTCQASHWPIHKPKCKATT